MLPECPCLLEHGIDKGRFAVIDMGDYGDVSDVLLSHVYFKSFLSTIPIMVSGD